MLTKSNSQVWHVLSSALVWSSEAFVLVAWPWVVGFARGLLSFGGEFQSPECGRVRPGDTEPAHVSRCDGEYRGVELLRAWSRVSRKSSSCSRYTSSPPLSSPKLSARPR